MDIFGIDVIWIIVAVIALPAIWFFLAGLKQINDNEVGILTKKYFGNKMPQGQIIARNGEIGIQADTLMPALYWRNPINWKIKKAPIVVIGPTNIGLVESVDGEQIPKGRLLGDEVDCNTYQDAKKFLGNGGKKGPQVGILRPGRYRINLAAFHVDVKNATIIPKENIGVVIANDGVPLPSGYIVAPKPKEIEDIKSHKFYQDGQSFLNCGGYRGPQLDTLQPGQYYINPLLFEVKVEPIAEVPPGYVAVLRSNVGIELEREKGTPVDAAKPLTLNQPVHSEVESLLILDKNMRGIWKEPVAPGKYNLNPLAFTPYLVPTSAVTIDWASGSDERVKHALSATGKQEDYSTDVEEFFKFSQLRVTSMDGFQLEVDVRMIIRIMPENAAFVIARFGSVKNLIEQIVHPLIDSSFRNKAGEKKAIDFFQSRTQLQKEALERAQTEFEHYHVEAQNLLIAYIAVDKTLLDTQTQKELALQQQKQYEEQARAQEKRIEVEAKNANANKQPEVVAAQLAIVIEQNKAEALRQTAAGFRDQNKITADGEKYKMQTLSEGTAYQTKTIAEGDATRTRTIAEADAAKTRVTAEAEAFRLKQIGDGQGYQLKVVADGKAYDQREVGAGIADAYRKQAEVLGPNATAMIKVVNEIGANRVKITPDILVAAASGDSGATALLSTWLAQVVKQGIGDKSEPLLPLPPAPTEENTMKTSETPPLQPSAVKQPPIEPPTSTKDDVEKILRDRRAKGSETIDRKGTM